MTTLLEWVALLVPTAVALTLATIAWRRIRETQVISAPAVTVTMFAAAAATGWFVTLATLNAIGPFTLGTTPIVAIPLESFEQELLTAGFVGGVSELEVLAGLSAAATIPAGLAVTLGYLPLAAIAALVALGCHAILIDRVFHRQLMVAAMVTAGICLVFGTAQQLLSNFAAGRAHLELLMADAIPVRVADLRTAELFDLAEFNLWPVGAAAGFAALALIIRQGARVRESARGLV